jgi:hypothetical protein
MSSTDARLNGAAVPLILVNKSGEEVTLLITALTDKDMTELDEWVRSEYIKNARLSLPANASTEERNETLALAFNQAFGLTFISGLGARMMGTVDGVSRLIWQGCRKEQPGITFEFVKSLMFDAKNVATSNETWKNLNVPGGNSKKIQPQAPGRRAKQTDQQKQKSTKP